MNDTVMIYTFCSFQTSYTDKGEKVRIKKNGPEDFGSFWNKILSCVHSTEGLNPESVAGSCQKKKINLCVLYKTELIFDLASRLTYDKVMLLKNVIKTICQSKSSLCAFSMRGEGLSSFIISLSGSAMPNRSVRYST